MSADYDLVKGWRWLDEQPQVTWLPISRSTRQKFALCYWHARSCGYDHAQARAECKKIKFFGWNAAMWLALQVLFYFLHQWWEQQS